MTEKDLEIQELRRELERIKKYVPELRESLESLCTICNQISEAKCYRVACELCSAAKVKQSISSLDGATIPQKAKNLQRGESTRGKAEKA